MNKLSMSAVNSFELMAAHLVDTYEQGAMFVVSDLERITSKFTSGHFDIPNMNVGRLLPKDGLAEKCIQYNQPLSEEFARAKFGMRLRAEAFPIFGDENNDRAIGTITMIFPIEPVVARAFPHLAPVLAEMFPDGAFIYMTGRNRISHRQASKKFDMPDLRFEATLTEDMVPYEVLKTQQPCIRELDASRYGIPVLTMAYPLYEEDRNGERMLTGTFCIALPKITAGRLREMSITLTRALEEISGVVEQVAASAIQVSGIYQKVHGNVSQVVTISKEINDVIDFIRNIADQTKMLGLNAAIEAARAQEIGRGFGVVAQEIQKLSEESKKTVTVIKELTSSIKDSLNETLKHSQTSLEFSEEQAAATEELSASIEEILALAQELKSISYKV